MKVISSYNHENSWSRSEYYFWVCFVLFPCIKGQAITYPRDYFNDINTTICLVGFFQYTLVNFEIKNLYVTSKKWNHKFT